MGESPIAFIPRLLQEAMGFGGFDIYGTHDFYGGRSDRIFNRTFQRNSQSDSLDFPVPALRRNFKRNTFAEGDQ